QFKLAVGNKSGCAIHVQSIFCDDTAGPDFYVQAMDHFEVVTDEMFKKLDVYAVLPSGEVLTYVVISNSEFFSYLVCGEDGYFSVLYPNDCINKEYLIDDVYGNIQIGLWKE